MNLDCSTGEGRIQRGLEDLRDLAGPWGRGAWPGAAQRGSVRLVQVFRVGLPRRSEGLLQR